MFQLKHFKQSFVALGLFVLLVACSGEKKPNNELEQAFKLHKEAMEIRNSLDDQLTGLLEESDTLFLKAHKNDLDSIERALKDWDEQLVEVPGFEEEHDHSGHHHHEEEIELTPEQHLEVQQHLLQEVKGIADRITMIEKQQ